MPARLAVPPARQSVARESDPAPEGWGLGAVVTARTVQVAAVGGDGTHISDDSSALPVGTEPLDAAWRVIAHALRRLTAEAEESRTTIAGLTVVLPGVVDSARGLVYDAAGDRAPVAAHDQLARRIGSPPSSLRLAALGGTAAAAEARATGAGLASVLCYLSADDEVACGVVSRGRALTGAEGLAGQVGHLQLDPLGHECFCGRRGCWVTVIGLPALLRHATDPDDPVRDPSLEVDAQVAEMERRARLEDGRTRRALAETGHALGVGIAMLSRLLDPDVVVLGGYLGELLPYVLPACEAARRAPHHRPDSPLGRITASRVTASDVARSAALAALTAGGEGVVG